MKNIFLENLGLKIASVLLSIVLWIFVTSRGQTEISLDVPLEFKNIPQGIEMISSSEKTISVNIKGQERFIKNIKPSDIRVSLDLSKARTGEATYYLNREDIKLPHAITVMNMNPSSVKVITDETISKTVKVLPVIIGEPEKGFSVKSVEVLPQYIVIEGTRSEVIKVGNIKTEPLDITGFNDSTAQDLKIDVTGKNIRAKMNTITVKVVITGRGK